MTSREANQAAGSATARPRFHSAILGIARIGGAVSWDGPATKTPAGGSLAKNPLHRGGIQGAGRPSWVSTAFGTLLRAPTFAHQGPGPGRPRLMGEE